MGGGLRIACNLWPYVSVALSNFTEMKPENNPNESTEMKDDDMVEKETKIDIGFAAGDVIKVDIGGEEYVFVPRSDTTTYEGVHNQDGNCGSVCLVEVDMQSTENIETNCTELNVEVEEKILEEMEDCVPQEVESVPPLPPPAKKKRVRNGKGGRWDDDVWDYFNYKRDKSGKKSDVSCRYCKYHAKWPKIERLRRHFYETCPEAKQNVLKERNLQLIHKRKNKDLSTLTPVRHNKTALDIQIARFIYSSKLQLSVVENPEFINLIRILKPSYQLPTRSQLETTILDKVYEDVVGEYSRSLQGKWVTVMQSGWCLNHSTCLVSHTLSVDCKSTHIVNMTSVEDKSLSNCYNLMLEAVEESERLHQCKVVAVVSDNTDMVNGLAERIGESRPELYVYACNTQLMNLVGKVVCQSETFEEVKKIQGFFNDNKELRGTLKEMKALDPILPDETRWTSEYACLKNHVKNHSAYSQIATREDVAIPTDISHRLFDLIFANNVNNSVKNLKPIAKALKTLQMESSTVAHAVKFWVNIKREVEIPAAHVKYFGDILQLALTPFACAAYLLHPKFRGEGLPPAYSALGLQWLDQKCSQYVLAQMKLSQGDKHYYPAALLISETIEGVCEENEAYVRRNQISASNWWRDVGKNMGTRLPEGLAELAERLQQLPASTSSSEKCYALMAPVMADTQARIGSQKTAKLCSVYRTLCDINESAE